MKENRKYRAILPNADTELRQRCMQAAENIYGDPLPEPVSTRLNEELSAIEAHQYATHYLIAAMIAETSKKEGYPVTTRGMIASALTAFLCGVTAVNPLPVHHWCPRCHNFELVGEEEGKHRMMGYGLPRKACPVCGSMMKSDGANIRPEPLMGLNLDQEPSICINVAAPIRPKLTALLKAAFGAGCVFRAGVKSEQSDGSIRYGIHPGGIFIVPSGTDMESITPVREVMDEEFQLPVTDRDYHELYGTLMKYDLLTLADLDMLHALEESTGMPADQISTDDPEILEEIIRDGYTFIATKGRDGISSFEQEVFQEAKPRDFTDLVRVSAMLHDVGAWFRNGDSLIRAGIPLQKLIAFRDDILQDLLAKGISRQRAFEIMNSVRKGKGVSEEMAGEMTAAGIPDWYIESCRKMEYLFPKAHAVEYALMHWKLAYYRCYYTDDFRKALEAYGKEAEPLI